MERRSSQSPAASPLELRRSSDSFPLPLTKNVGVSVNFGKGTPQGQHIFSQHQEHTTSNNENSAINLKTIAGQTEANSREMSPAATSANKGVPQNNDGPELADKSSNSSPSENTQGPTSPSSSTSSGGKGTEQKEGKSRIVSQNVNGTLAVTGVPTNDSELQLFRVLQRANLLNYFDMMIELGGDDVQQLCDAGNEEFLEIMALIGMAQKPLHVRRLQKALQEWMTQPSLFQAPVLPPGYGSSTQQLFPQLAVSPPAAGPIPMSHLPSFSPGIYPTQSLISTPSSEKNGYPNPLEGVPPQLQAIFNHQPQQQPRPKNDIKIAADQLIPSHFLETRIRTGSEASSPTSFPNSPHDSRNSISPLPNSLQESEIEKLAESAINFIRSLPPTVAEPKFSKKKASGDYELILRIPETDLRRMDEIRRVAQVYGRVDRRKSKALSMHELAINEASAQLCKHVPALLTKREELLNLSRQVVRDSGLPYAAISSTFSISILAGNNNDIYTKSKYEEPRRNGSFSEQSFPKRLRLDGSSAGIEIQEYSQTRPISLQSPQITNGMQITELLLPPRRLDSPLELVTVQGRAGSRASSDSQSPPISRFREDLTNFRYEMGRAPVKITSIPVSGGNISISSGLQYTTGHMKLPIKSESPLN